MDQKKANRHLYFKLRHYQNSRQEPAQVGQVPIAIRPIWRSKTQPTDRSEELLSKVGDAGFRRRVRLAFLRP